MQQFGQELLVFTIHLLEWMGILVIAVTSIRAFGTYVFRKLDFTDDRVKVMLAKSLAVGLEFKLGAEILKTVMVQTLDEVYMLAAIVILRVVLTFVIDWEIRTHEAKEAREAALRLASGADPTARARASNEPAA